MLLTKKPAHELQQNLSQVLFFFFFFNLNLTLKDRSSWPFTCLEKGISLRDVLTVQIINTQVTLAAEKVVKRRCTFRSQTTAKTSNRTGE